METTVDRYAHYDHQGTWHLVDEAIDLMTSQCKKDTAMAAVLQSDDVLTLEYSPDKHSECHEA